ncbi:hypothetical protein [Eisenibacter elegans]|jgi:hypothetical protein|uniref:hypothetical protein n=1 Tax=Eisenibacter elegans TaxID=997 RepID=UPI0004275C2E|nr:hypothetical protein [Eisenibacter elegans]
MKNQVQKHNNQALLDNLRRTLDDLQKAQKNTQGLLEVVHQQTPSISLPNNPANY